MHKVAVRTTGDGHLQCVEIELKGKVVEGSRSESSAEQQLAIIDVAKELERVRVGGVLPEDCPGLENKLVGAEVGALEEGQLVLVGEVQRAHDIFEDAEVEGLDALCAGVGAIVAGRDELSPAEADLVVEDGVVADEDLDWFGTSIEVKLVPILVGLPLCKVGGINAPRTRLQLAAAVVLY